MQWFLDALIVHKRANLELEFFISVYMKPDAYEFNSRKLIWVCKSLCSGY